MLKKRSEVNAETAPKSAEPQKKYSVSAYAIVLLVVTVLLILLSYFITKRNERTAQGPVETKLQVVAAQQFEEYLPEGEFDWREYRC